MSELGIGEKVRTESSVCKLMGEGNSRGRKLSTKLISLNYLILAINTNSLRLSKESWLHITCSISMKCAKSAKNIETESRVVIARGCRNDGGIVIDCLMVIGFLFRGDKMFWK